MSKLVTQISGWKKCLSREADSKACHAADKTQHEAMLPRLSCGFNAVSSQSFCGAVILLSKTTTLYMPQVSEISANIKRI